MIDRLDHPSPLPLQVVVVYFKRTRRPIFRTPSAVAGLWRLGNRVGNRVRGVEQADAKPEEDADEVKVVLGGSLLICRLPWGTRDLGVVPPIETNLKESMLRVRGYF